MDLTIALDVAHDGAFRAGEAWGRALLYVVLVILLVLLLRRLRRRRHANNRDTRTDDRAVMPATQDDNASSDGN